jgi:hypothetical protein
MTTTTTTKTTKTQTDCWRHGEPIKLGIRIHEATKHNNAQLEVVRLLRELQDGAVGSGELEVGVFHAVARIGERHPASIRRIRGCIDTGGRAQETGVNALTTHALTSQRGPTSAFAWCTAANVSTRPNQPTKPTLRQQTNRRRW